MKDAEFLDALAIAHVFTMLKCFITLGGIEGGSDHILQTQNMIITNACMLWERWNCSAVWSRFMADWHESARPKGKTTNATGVEVSNTDAALA